MLTQNTSIFINIEIPADKKTQTPADTGTLTDPFWINDNSTDLNYLKNFIKNYFHHYQFQCCIWCLLNQHEYSKLRTHQYTCKYIYIYIYIYIFTFIFILEYSSLKWQPTNIWDNVQYQKQQQTAKEEEDFPTKII